MSDFDRNYAATRRGVGTDRAVAVDQGLRAYMIRVYNYMAVGVALTGVVAWLAFQAAGGDAIQITPRGIIGVTQFGQLILSFPGQIVLFLGELDVLRRGGGFLRSDSPPCSSRSRRHSRT